jgi:hypothetical protein
VGLVTNGSRRLFQNDLILVIGAGQLSCRRYAINAASPAARAGLMSRGPAGYHWPIDQPRLEVIDYGP